MKTIQSCFIFLCLTLIRQCIGVSKTAQKKSQGYDSYLKSFENLYWLIRSNLLYAGISFFLILFCCTCFTLRYCFGVGVSSDDDKKKKRKKKKRKKKLTDEEEGDDDRPSENEGELSTAEDEWMAVGSGGAEGGAFRVHDKGRHVRNKATGLVGKVAVGEPMNDLDPDIKVRDVVRVHEIKPRAKSFMQAVTTPFLSSSRLSSRSIELQEKNSSRVRAQSKSPVPSFPIQEEVEEAPVQADKYISHFCPLPVYFPTLSSRTSQSSSPSSTSPPPKPSESPLPTTMDTSIKVQTRVSLLCNHQAKVPSGRGRSRSPQRSHSPSRSASPVRIGVGGGYVGAGNPAYFEKAFDPRKKRNTSFANGTISRDSESPMRGNSNSRSPSPSRAFGGPVPVHKDYTRQPSFQDNQADVELNRVSEVDRESIEEQANAEDMIYKKPVSRVQGDGPVLSSPRRKKSFV